MKKKTTYIIFAIVIVVIATFLVASKDKPYEGIDIIVYKSASCGCCGNYIPYLKAKGFDVEIIVVEDVSSIRAKYGVPEGMESCHTTIIEGYFIEGHVPLEAIDKLLEERPDIDGISLPNMPSGSPGMPGTKARDFLIFSITNGETSEFMRL